MCFSASASFGAGVILAAVSVNSITKIQKPSQIYFACIPVLFCVQQIAEGFLWLALTKPVFAPLQGITTEIFLFFSQVVWPLWIPFAFLKLETDEKEKNFQRLLLLLGMIISFYLAYCLVTYNVEAKNIGTHISFQQTYPIAYGSYSNLLYIIATVAPPLFSDIKKMWLLSIAILFSYIITSILYVDYIVSVWSFFSLIIGLSVLIVTDEIKYPSKKHSKYYYSSDRSKSSSIKT